jgi:predicted nuclease of predicted toxin-antitoxin system
MTIWLDAQLPPSLAAWIATTFGVECHAVRDLSLRDAKDSQIFQAARDAEADVMTKDSDLT